MLEYSWTCNFLGNNHYSSYVGQEIRSNRCDIVTMQEVFGDNVLGLQKHWTHVKYYSRLSILCKLRWMNRFGYRHNSSIFLCFVWYFFSLLITFCKYFISHFFSCLIRLPIRWDKTDIIVMNEVRVSSPYLPENVVGGTPAANDRVKKVVRFHFIDFENFMDSKSRDNFLLFSALAWTWEEEVAGSKSRPIGNRSCLFLTN